MKPGMAILPGVAADTGYSIGNSALFDGSTGYFHRTPGSAGDSQTWTFSWWMLMTEVPNLQKIFGA